MIPKFRVWNKSQKKMFFGPDKRYQGQFAIIDSGVLCWCDSHGHLHPVSEENLKNLTIMPSVGLPDRKGVEAFKDDIVKTGNGRIWVIKHGTYFWHVPKQVIELYGFYLEPLPNLDNHPIPIHEGVGEIIGNCHQHPELLEGKA